MVDLAGTFRRNWLQANTQPNTPPDNTASPARQKSNSAKDDSSWQMDQAMTVSTSDVLTSAYGNTT